jgi:hypothetical protein
MTPTKLLLGQILTVFASVLFGMWFATQWAAYRLAYQPELEVPDVRCRACRSTGLGCCSDRDDFHTWQLIRGVAMSTLIGIGSDLQFSGNGGLVEAIRQSGSQNVSRAADQLTARALDIQPTTTIRPGVPVLLIVNRDLILAPRKGDR